MKKMFVLIALSGMAIVSAKTYDVRISQPALIGNATLKPGSYRLKVEGTTATLTDRKGQAVGASGAVASGDRKYSQTAVDFVKDGNGQDRVQEIDLGGTHSAVSFNR